MDDTGVQRWKGLTGKVHAVEAERGTPKSYRTICGIPVQQREIITSSNAEAISCQVCRIIMAEMKPPGPRSNLAGQPQSPPTGGPTETPPK